MFIKSLTTETQRVEKSAKGVIGFLKENNLINAQGEATEEVKVFLGGLFFKETKDTKEGFPWVFSTFDLDRDSERIDPAGWKLDNYLKNPVVLWAHDSRIPAIGYSREIQSGKSLGGRVVFNDKAFDEFGWGIGERVKAGVIRAGSVGFLIEKVEIVENDGQEHLVFRNQELLEFSICNVPSNPFALNTGGGFAARAHEVYQPPAPPSPPQMGMDIEKIPLPEDDEGIRGFWRGVIREG